MCRYIYLFGGVGRVGSQCLEPRRQQGAKPKQLAFIKILLNISFISTFGQQTLAKATCLNVVTNEKMIWNSLPVASCWNSRRNSKKGLVYFYLIRRTNTKPQNCFRAASIYAVSFEYECKAVCTWGQIAAEPQFMFMLGAFKDVLKLIWPHVGRIPGGCSGRCLARPLQAFWRGIRPTTGGEPGSGGQNSVKQSQKMSNMMFQFP